jgi:hypothetical protein
VFNTVVLMSTGKEALLKGEQYLLETIFVVVAMAVEVIAVAATVVDAT